MPIAFVLALVLPQTKWKSFWAAGIGVAFVYCILCLIADIGNEHILSIKMAVLFKVPTYFIIHLISVLIGFITAGLGGLIAGMAMQIIRADPPVKNDP